MSDPYLDILGQRIRVRRSELGMSQDGLAHAAGLDRTYVGRIERGEHNLTFVALVRLARAMKCAIYAKAVAQYAQIMSARLSEALEEENLKIALLKAFDDVIDSYTAAGADGCFILCTAPADALTNPVCRSILERAVDAIDGLFLRRLEREQTRFQTEPVDLELLAAQLGALVHSLAIRARAGWSPDRLRRLVVGSVAPVLAPLGQ